MLIYYKIIMVL